MFTPRELESEHTKIVRTLTDMLTDMLPMIQGVKSQTQTKVDLSVLIVTGREGGFFKDLAGSVNISVKSSI